MITSLCDHVKFFNGLLGSETTVGMVVRITPLLNVWVLFGLYGRGLVGGSVKADLKRDGGNFAFIF